MKTKYVFLSAIALLASGCATTSPVSTARKVASDNSVLKNFRCDNSEAVQYTDAEGKTLGVEINKQKIIGTREESTEGEFKVFRTTAKMFQNSQTTPISDYTAVRKTKTIKLPNDIVREISETQRQSLTPTGEKNPVVTTKSILDYKVQKEGSLRLVRQFENGQQVKIEGNHVRIFGADGAEASFSSNHKESESPQDDGATFKTLQYYSVCNIIPAQ